MAITSFSGWSTTAASNVDLNGIPISDDTEIAQVDDLFREMMAQLKSGVPGKVGTTTDNAVARYDSTAGQLQNSALVVDDNGHVSSFGGQIVFPATQSASSNANTLDDYEEGTWTPVVTFVSPGNLAVTYSTQVGTYIKIGRQVHANFTIATATFTHTTASQSLAVTALPFSADTTASQEFYGTLSWGGITKTNYTYIAPRLLDSSTTLSFVGSGSGQTRSLVTASDVPTGGNVVLIGTISYRAGS